MSGLCQFSNALGAPGRGVHAPRIGGLAAFDLLGTALLAGLLAGVATRHGAPAWVSALVAIIIYVILLVVAVAAHELFCVNTRLNATLFGRPWPGPLAERP